MGSEYTGVAIDRLSWEPLFVVTFEVGYDRAVHTSEGPNGIRSLFPIDGGSFEGERLRGTVEPNGADWVHWRPDGAMAIDVRVMLKTDDGAAIAMTYTGVTSGAAEPMNRFLTRQKYAFEEIYSRTTPRFETGDQRYSWLNTTIAVANGKRTTGKGPVYHVFAIK